MVKGKRRPFYGYIIVAVSFLILVPMHGLQSSYGVFFDPLHAEFGWSRATISGAAALGTFTMGLFAIMSGRLTDKFGPRITVMLCGVILGSGYLLMSRTSSVVQLYLFYGLMTGIGTSSGDVSLLSTVARWFVKRRGLMTATVKVGTGTGQVIMPLVTTLLIAGYGWRHSVIILAIIAMVSIIILAQFLKRDPGKIGLQPYGAVNPTGNNSHIADEGFSLHEIRHTRQFIMLCGILFALWYSTSNIMIHIVPHALDLGFSPTRAAAAASIIGGASIFGRLVMGVTGDRIGIRRALVRCFLILVVTLVWLQFATDYWSLYLFAAVYGFSHGGFFALSSPLVAELFGMKAHGEIFGTGLFIGQIGGAMGTVIAGHIFDVTGSYHIAFMIAAALGVIGLVLSVLLKPLVKKGVSYS